VADQEISYPTDAGLRNTARKQSEQIIDLLHKQSTVNKPRDYRRIARTAVSLRFFSVIQLFTPITNK
ncbi:MAG: hypothetical protein ACWIPI_03495, partial [Polaribacter sp.]